jgi:hypothetical protein
MSRNQIAEIAACFMSLIRNNEGCFQNHEGFMTTGIIFSQFYLHDENFNEEFVNLICSNLKTLRLIRYNGNLMRFQYKNRKIDLQYFKNNEMLIINLKLLHCEPSKSGG